MDMMSWIIFGLIAGIIATSIDDNPTKGGLIGSVMLGIAGSLVGGFLASMIFGIGILGFDLNSFIVAIIGALVLLYIGKEVRKA